MTQKYVAKIEIHDIDGTYGYYMVFWGKIINGYTDAKLFPFCESEEKASGPFEPYEIARAGANGYMAAKLSEMK